MLEDSLPIRHSGLDPESLAEEEEKEVIALLLLSARNLEIPHQVRNDVKFVRTEEEKSNGRIIIRPNYKYHSCIRGYC